MKPILAVLAAALFVAAPASRARAEDTAYPELPNFHRVDASLYRGGQPAEGGIERLKALGIRTIVNLRYERALNVAEEAEARAAGLLYYNVPMYGLTRPPDEKVKRALALINDPKNQPVFVHCAAGSDRTGAIVACYRIERSQWTAESAIREAMSYGMMRAEVAKRAFVKDFYARFQQAATALAAASAAP
jgi:protein tyrosine/serine phosphatase